MSIQFPANPQLNATFDYDDKTYIWDGEKWTASAIGSFDEAYVNISGDTMTGDLTVPSLNGGPLGGFRNALINGVLDHWQRGTSGFAGVGTYAADRWVLGGNSPAASRVTIAAADANAGVPCTYGISVSSTGGAHATIRQGVELIGGGGRPNQFQVGSQWTLSFYANTQTLADVSYGFSCGFSNDANLQAGSSGAWTLGTYQKLEDVGATWARYSVTYTVNIAPAGSNLCVSVPLSSKGDGSAVIYTGIQFELSPVATPLEIRPVGTELALCQRYYLNAKGQKQYETSSGSWNRYIPIFFPTTMRATPTIKCFTSAGVEGSFTTSAGSTPATVFGTDTTGTSLGANFNGTYMRISYTADAEL